MPLDNMSGVVREIWNDSAYDSSFDIFCLFIDKHNEYGILIRNQNSFNCIFQLCKGLNLFVGENKLIQHWYCMFLIVGFMLIIISYTLYVVISVNKKYFFFQD